MNAILCAELRLLLNREGFRNWTIKPNPNANGTLIHLREPSGHNAVYLEQPRGRETGIASVPLVQDWVEFRADNLPDALSDALDWIKNHREKHKPHPGWPPM